MKSIRKWTKWEEKQETPAHLSSFLCFSWLQNSLKHNALAFTAKANATTPVFNFLQPRNEAPTYLCFHSSDKRFCRVELDTPTHNMVFKICLNNSRIIINVEKNYNFLCINTVHFLYFLLIHAFWIKLRETFHVVPSSYLSHHIHSYTM